MNASSRSTTTRAPSSAPDPSAPAAEASTGELVARATRQISDLVRQEMALARAELADKGRHAGRGAGLFGGAGVIAWYGGAALVGAAVAGLAVVWPVWASALLIGVVLLAVAGLLAMVGRGQFRQAVPPMPGHAAESVKTDVHEIKEHITERHHR